MSIHTIRLPIAASLLLALGGCASNHAYRDDLSAVCVAAQDADCPASAVQQHAPGQADEYHLGFIEFDDQGQVRDRRQMQAVLDKYYALASQQGVILVAFAHGWHHNAHPGDTNIESFRGLLGKIAQMESASSRRKVLGVYLGWRGESITVPVVNNLTFWERKNTAEEVGLQGVPEVLLKLEEIVNVKSADGGARVPPSHLFVIGHSFGGAVVFTALQQILADRFVDSRQGKNFSGDANGFGDLVVLLNPAFEAMRYSTLYDMAQAGCRRYFPSQVPRLAVLTSEADLATKLAFPAGRWFSTLFETHGTLTRHLCQADGEKLIDIKEGEADRQTVGHFEPYITHRLLPAGSHPGRSDPSAFRQLQNLWATQAASGKLDFDGSELVHLDKTRPLNPYLNIRVDQALIPNHNDVWGDEILGFIRDLILMTTLPPVEPAKAQ